LISMFAMLAEGRPPWADALTSPLTLVFLLMIFMLFFSWRSKKTQETQRQALLKAVKRGDRVQTIGGILGTVVEVREQDDEIVVKVDESSNAKIHFIRAAIARVVEADGKEKAQAR
jgi:preprotein translocase subunit YajC